MTCKFLLLQFENQIKIKAIITDKPTRIPLILVDHFKFFSLIPIKFR
jgi:hypothetical protein